MDIKSLEELQWPDERTRHFTPFGLGPKISAQEAAAYQQQIIAHLDLAEVVPERVREAFEQLRTLYSYGVLCYDLYTVAHDRAASSSSTRCASGCWTTMAAASPSSTRTAPSTSCGRPTSTSSTRRSTRTTDCASRTAGAFA